MTNLLLRTFRLCATLALALLISAPAMAASISPAGQWEVTTGDARYKVTICGDGTALCAKLVWLAPAARTVENLALLNTYVVRGATATGETTWSGDVTLDGRSYSGTVTLVSKNYLKLKGCSGFLCQTYEFTRI
ncbi:hypothetical protein BH10PLA2_BH10PLA2_38660 [soil metagenome]